MIKTRNIGYLVLLLLIMLVAPVFSIMTTDVLAQKGYSNGHSWVYDRHDLGNTASTDAEPLEGTGTVWKFNVERSNVTFSGPLVDLNEVYVAYSDKKYHDFEYIHVQSLYLDSGNARWDKFFSTWNNGTIYLYNNLNIFVGRECLYLPYQKEISVNGTGYQNYMGIIALNRSDGKVLWNTEFGEYILQPFLSDEGIGVVERILDDGLYYRSLDQLTGKILRSKKLPFSSIFFNAGIGPVIYYQNSANHLEAFDLNSMTVLWQSTSIINNLQERPIVTDDSIFVSDISSIKAFNKTTGKELWSIDTMQFGRGYAANDRWLATSNSVINVIDGTLAWSLPKVWWASFPWDNPTIAGNVLYEGVVDINVSNNNTKVLAFNIISGNELVNLTFPGSSTISSIAAIDGRIIFGANSYIYCIGDMNQTVNNTPPTVKLFAPLHWPPKLTMGNFTVNGIATDTDKNDGISALRMKIYENKNHELALDKIIEVDPPVTSKNFSWILDTTILSSHSLLSDDDFYNLYIYAYDTRGSFSFDWGNISVYNTFFNPLEPPVLTNDTKIDIDGSIDVTVDQSVNLTAPVYLDFPANTTKYSWDLGDGTKENSRSIVHKYIQAGNYDLDLTLDNGERSISYHTKVIVKPPANNNNEQPPLRLANKTLVLSVSSIFMISIIAVVFLTKTEVGTYGFLSLVVPLYTRIKKDEVLDHFTRGKIIGFLQSNPGVNYNSIKDELDLHNGALTYHLQVMEREGYIKSDRDGIYKRFYLISAKRSDKISLEELVLATVRKNPGISQKEIAFRTGRNQTTIHRILFKLNKIGLIEIEKKGKTHLCYLKEENEEAVV